MIAADSDLTIDEVPVTPVGIPIRNLWYILLYAWNEIRIKDRSQVEVEASPTLDALLASILANLIEQRFRIGLGRSYAYQEKLLHGIRGRIIFAESIKRLAFENAQAYCRFQDYSPNVPKNQIVRSTLARLVQIGEFGADRQGAEILKHRLRKLVRDMDGIDLIELSPAIIRRQQFGRNDGDYRLMLAICELILHRQLPTESVGIKSMPGLDRDALILHRVYERFIANFYKMHLSDWYVTPQAPLKWHETEASQFLPDMRPDLLLRNKSSGRIVMLDTKFTPKGLVTNRWGKNIFDSGHVYQMYAYLRSQEHLSKQYTNATGILLYPAAQYTLAEQITLQNHPIRVVTIDLAQPWEGIEFNLLRIIDEALKFMNVSHKN